MKRIAWLVTLLLPLSGLPALAASNGVEQHLIERISEANLTLVSAEKRIGNERLSIAKHINALEQEVLALREKTAVARRRADEKTLSLTQLEARVEHWQQQQIFQQNLLHRFLQRHGQQLPELAPSAKPSGALSEQISAVIRVSEQLAQSFSPGWREADLIMANGKIAAVPTLKVGPVNWYWDESAMRVGLASSGDDTANRLKSAALLSETDSAVVASLRTYPEGEILFDPTLDRVIARQQNTESVWQHVVKGGMWVIPIILFALFALTIALLKTIHLWRLPKPVRFTPAVLASILRDGNTTLCSGVKGMQKVLLDIGGEAATARQRDDALFMQLLDDKHILERWIGAIAITAAVSPLLGLLGTVSGMIETFKMMTLFGSGDPEVVSGGISQALITTELGLIVAIPALLLNALLSRKAKSYYFDLENFAILLSKVEDSEPPTAAFATTAVLAAKSTSPGIKHRSVAKSPVAEDALP